MKTSTRVFLLALWAVICLLLAVWIAPRAHAQNNVITQPLQGSGTNASTTVASTDVYQQAFAASTTQRGRSGCTVVNYGTHTMWVYEDNQSSPVGLTAVNAAVSTYKGKSVQLSAGQPYYCGYNGTVIRGAIFITGTSGDAFFAAQQ